MPLLRLCKRKGVVLAVRLEGLLCGVKEELEVLNMVVQLNVVKRLTRLKHVEHKGELHLQKVWKLSELYIKVWGNSRS
jgi:hypothetical protein